MKEKELFTTLESIPLTSCSLDAGISCSERLQDIYGGLAQEKTFFFLPSSLYDTGFL